MKKAKSILNERKVKVEKHKEIPELHRERDISAKRSQAG